MAVEKKENRIIADLRVWKAREDVHKEVMGPEIVNTPSFLLEKKEYYRDLALIHTDNLTAEEKFTLRVIKDEMKDLVKKAYPNKFERFLVQVHEAMYDVADSIARRIEAFQDKKLSKDAEKITPTHNTPENRKEIPLKEEKKKDDKMGKAFKDIDETPLLTKLRSRHGKGLSP